MIAPDQPRLVIAPEPPSIIRPQKGEVLEAFPYHELEMGESAGVIGVSQYGKSTWAMGWAAFLMALGLDVIAWDPCWEWAQDAKKRIRARPGPLSKTVTVAELEQDPDLLLRSKLSLAVRPDDIYAPRVEIAKQFTRFIYIVRRLVSFKLCLFIDECNLLGDAADVLDDVAERGGKDGLLPVFLAQRWSHFTPNMRAEFAWLVAFFQFKDSDLRFLKLDAGEPMAAAVCALDKRQYRATYLRTPNPTALAAAGLTVPPSPQRRRAAQT